MKLTLSADLWNCNKKIQGLEAFNKDTSIVNFLLAAIIVEHFSYLVP
jgi:hypothetical protein